MQYRKYGKTDLTVSALGFGAMRLPRIVSDDGSAAPVDREKAYELIRYAADNGVTYFDTAFGYHAQESEAILGEALEGERRKKVVISTKQPFGVMTTNATIRENLENTLRKLRTDHVDIYMIHAINAGTWADIKRRDIIGEYEKLRAEGLIGNIAFSMHGEVDTFKEIVGFYDWAGCLVQHNFLDTDREVTAEGIRFAGERGCAVTIMEPLRGGGLAGAPAPVKEIYDSTGENFSPAEWAFRYLIDFPEISSVLSGVTTIEQLKQNIEIFSKADALPGCLTAAQREMYPKVKAAYESIVTIPCTYCEYCMPCPAGVDVPNAFSLYNEGMMFGNFGQPRRSYMFAAKGQYSADHCVKCGACEPKCPQNIAIMNHLETAHDALKGWVETK
ncbi:MAG: aldo/keto reductase [Oscillospiraceae bacterium]|nr:aldo/keto reductase [Oscillospiraceae bacterium]